jgi:SAM-dependent methyltransferase
MSYTPRRTDRHPRRPEDFDEYYAERAPWDVGHPQPAIRAVAGEFTGRVLDVGCGTGEHALLAASLGLSATGVDTSPVAIERARAKAAERGLEVRFEVGNALELTGEFETIVDSALFHVFEDDDRIRYVASIAAVTRPGARLYLLCFSDAQEGEWGPRRVSEAEIRAAFADGWRIDSLEPATVEVTGGGAKAWLASISRV